MFHLQFETANAAFEGGCGTEIARILRQVATEFASGSYDGLYEESARLFDINGNRVGFWSLEMKEV